jgi:hypothetical protein
MGDPCTPFSLISRAVDCLFYIRWHANYRLEGDKVIDIAELKLTNGTSFNEGNMYHVFAVLSQRLCLDTVLAARDDRNLADRSVSYHMRLLTGISPESKALYTYSPSEPVLALAATRLLFAIPGSWARVLDTLSERLCQSGLIEKGLTGELGARTLLLIARDLAAPKENNRPDFLKPVPLLDFLDVLFGNTSWCSKETWKGLFDAFNDTYVNFTHWITTKDPLPEVPDRYVDIIFCMQLLRSCLQETASKLVGSWSCGLSPGVDRPIHSHI